MLNLFELNFKTQHGVIILILIEREIKTEIPFEGLTISEATTKAFKFYNEIK